ncbi:FAD-dependent urate hydroxylase [Nymphon striatum]|nr:FAD-dependent urate hydroxylase [Nymphon striatum]
MLKIAVAGAGIGGLAFAAGAAQSGHNVTVFDQMHAPAPVGSGLVIQPVGQSVLAAIGALEEATAMGAHISRMVGHETLRGRRVLDVSYDRTGGKAHGLAIHRAALFDALLKAAIESGAIIRSSHQVVAADGKDLVFADGMRRRDFDLIVDATGARSPLSPIVARSLSFRCDLGHRRLADFDDWKARGLTHWQDDATQLWPEFAPFAEQITDPSQMVMARYSHGTLRRPFQGTNGFYRRLCTSGQPSVGAGREYGAVGCVGAGARLAQDPPECQPRLAALCEVSTLACACLPRHELGVYAAISVALAKYYLGCVTTFFFPCRRCRQSPAF